MCGRSPSTCPAWEPIPSTRPTFPPTRPRSHGLLDETGGTFVLCGHSYGGMVVTVAAAGRSDIGQLVYLCAFMPDVGESLFGLTGGGLAPWIDVLEDGRTIPDLVHRAEVALHGLRRGDAHECDRSSTSAGRGSIRGDRDHGCLANDPGDVRRLHRGRVAAGRRSSAACSPSVPARLSSLCRVTHLSSRSLHASPNCWRTLRDAEPSPDRMMARDRPSHSLAV